MVPVDVNILLEYAGAADETGLNAIVEFAIPIVIKVAAGGTYNGIEIGWNGVMPPVPVEIPFELSA
jgi:primosomal replication protein N